MIDTMKTKSAKGLASKSGYIVVPLYSVRRSRILFEKQSYAYGLALLCRYLIRRGFEVRYSTKQWRFFARKVRNVVYVRGPVACSDAVSLIERLC